MTPSEYEEIVSSAHVGIAGFGGAFLAMVGLVVLLRLAKRKCTGSRGWNRWLSKYSSIKAAEIALLLLVNLRHFAAA
jgi:hypothetical protein